VNTTVLASPGRCRYICGCDGRCRACEETFAEIEQGFEIALTEQDFFARRFNTAGSCRKHADNEQRNDCGGESCTGGLLAERLTSIAGSSTYFLGEWFCYSNEEDSVADVPKN